MSKPLRDLMPTVASIVDEYRQFMGRGAKVVFASEAGHVLDRREPIDPDKVFTIPANYRPMWTAKKR
jgi:hypothetical protein